MRERLIESNLKSRIEDRGGLCIKLSPDYFNGLPDRMVILPGAKVIFVELKAPGKKPGDMQIWVHKKLRGLGFSVLVLDTLEKVKQFIDELQPA